MSLSGHNVKMDDRSKYIDSLTKYRQAMSRVDMTICSHQLNKAC